MTEIRRHHHVEAVETVPGRPDRLHAILAARAGDEVDVVHLWTDDAALRDGLAAGRDIIVTFDLVPPAPPP